MSSTGNGTTVKTNSSPAAATSSASSSSSSGSSLSGFFTPERIMIVMATLVALGCYITSFVLTSQFIGSSDSWTTIKPQIQKIWMLTLAGSFALFVASIMYYIQEPKMAIYFILILTCLSFGLSYSAIAISAISK